MAVAEPARQSTTQETGVKRKPERDGFSTHIGALLATLGSAVGLGNIWKFPAFAGKNGGAAFVLVYLACVFVVGIPLMVAELSIGRAARANAVGTFKRLSPKRPWFLIGAGGAVAAFIIMAFYTDVAGWVFAYVFRALTGALPTTVEGTSAAFDQLVSSSWEPLIWQWIVLAVTTTIVMAGVKKGIEGAIRRLMPALLVLLLISVARAVTLPGAAEGVAFLLKPDLSRLSWSVVLLAMGLAFFKLSLGMGTMITYGSYMPEKSNLFLTAVRVAAADTTISLLAGLAIFPAVFHFGFEPTAGPALLFNTIPAVLGSLPFGRLFTASFFVLTAAAATGAMLSLLEVPIAYLHEERNLPRRTAALITALGIAVLGVPATLSTGPLAGLKIFGLTFFDLFDFLSQNILMPIGGIAIAVYVGWFLRRQKLLGEGPAARYVSAALKFVVPVAIGIILLNGLGLFA